MTEFYTCRLDFFLRKAVILPSGGLPFLRIFVITRPVRKQKAEPKKLLDFDVTTRDMIPSWGSPEGIFGIPMGVFFQEVKKMEYSIRELSELAGVSARTLRYYDEIGLLKPLYTNEAGYRYYGENQVMLLQQILFYRKRGFELKQIRKILYQTDFDILAALEEHLLELENQKRQTDALIKMVKQTISSMKGEYVMSDQEKFQAFKEEMIEKNEEKYGWEIRQKYGDQPIDASNQKIMDMSQEQWDKFQKLEATVLEKLESCVENGFSRESEAARELVTLHKEWLCMSWKQYSVQAHKGVACMYISDERFTAYYDRKVKGCASFLQQAVEYWADKI